MRQTSLQSCAALALSLLSAAAAYGQRVSAPGQSAPPASAVVYVFGDLVSADSLAPLVGTTYEVTAADIAIRGVRDVASAVALLPGLEVRTGSDGIPRINIRGFRARHAVVLVDGVPFNSTYDGQFDPSIIPVSQIARITVSYGTSSVLYGTGDLGGVVNIVTRKTTAGPNVELNSGGGTDRLGTATGTVSLGGERYSFMASGGTDRRHGWPVSRGFAPTPYEDGGARENSGKRIDHAIASVELRPSPSWLFGVSAHAVQGGYGQPPTVANSTTDIFADPIKYQRVEDLGTESYQGGAQWTGDHGLSVRGWGYYNRQDERDARYDNACYCSFDTTALKGTYLLTSLAQISGAQFQARYVPGKTRSLTAAASVERDGWAQTGFIRDIPLTSPRNTYGVRNVNDDRYFDVTTLAVEYNQRMTDAVGVTAGLGWAGQSRVEGTREDGWSPMAGIQYAVSDNARLSLSAARKIRFPSIRQFYDSAQGNASLAAERSTNVDAGYEQQFGAYGGLTARVFNTNVENYIETNATTQVFENNQAYRFRGLELSWHATPVGGLTLDTSYSYLWTRDRSAHTEKQELQYRPTHKIAVNAGYRFKGGLTVQADGVWMAGAYYYSRKSPLVKAELPSSLVADIRLSQRLGRGISAYAQAANLFDANYQQAYGYPQPGRTVMLGLTAGY